MRTLWILCALALASLSGAAGAQTRTITGTVKYEDRPFTFTGFTNVTPLPQRLVRFADVDLVNFNGTAVLASGTTNVNGVFQISLPVPSSGGVTFRVRCMASSTRSANMLGSQIISAVVIDTATPPAIHAVQSIPFTVTSSAVPFPTGTLVSFPVTPTNTQQTGNPFNILDLAIASFEYVTGPNLGFNRPGNPLLTYQWPVAGTGSFASYGPNQGPPYLAQIDETSGYDDSVILHETGHLVHFLYSGFSSSPEWHTFGQSNQEPRLSFTEGWATYFGSTVMRNLNYATPGIYVDTLVNAFGQTTININANLETALPFNFVPPGPNATAGDCDELAVACLLWDIADSATGLGDDDPLTQLNFPGSNGAQRTFQVFNGPLFVIGVPITLANFWNGWVLANPGLYTQVRQLFEGRKVFYSNDALEPNNTVATATPFTPSATYSPSRSLYFSPGSSLAPGNLDVDFYSFPVVAGSTFQVQTRYPGNAVDAETMADTFLEVFAPGSSQAVWWADGGGADLNAALTYTALQSGTYAVSVSTLAALAPVRAYGRYELRIQVTSINAPPAVSVNTPNQIIGGGGTAAASLAVTATDPNLPITYTWTPQNGGAIQGSGSSVQFLPPPVSVDTTFTIQFVARDSLGAPSAPVSMNVTVYRSGKLYFTGSSSVGQPIQFRLSAPPNSPYLLAVANDSTAGVSVPGLNGLYLLDPAGTVILVQNVTVPASGIAIWNAVIPADPGLIQQDFFFQAVYGNTFSDLLQIDVTQ